MIPQKCLTSGHFYGNYMKETSSFSMAIWLSQPSQLKNKTPSINYLAYFGISTAHPFFVEHRLLIQYIAKVYIKSCATFLIIRKYLAYQFCFYPYQIRLTAKLLCTPWKDKSIHSNLRLRL